ncbi:MAG: hypothetical protein ACRD0D_15740 [Acidimicrobiales bacterium]
MTATDRLDRLADEVNDALARHPRGDAVVAAIAGLRAEAEGWVAVSRALHSRWGVEAIPLALDHWNRRRNMARLVTAVDHALANHAGYKARVTGTYVQLGLSVREGQCGHSDPDWHLPEQCYADGPFEFPVLVGYHRCDECAWVLSDCVDTSSTIGTMPRGRLHWGAETVEDVLAVLVTQVTIRWNDFCAP